MPKRLLRSIFILAFCLGVIICMKIFLDRKIEVARLTGDLLNPN